MMDKLAPCPSLVDQPRGCISYSGSPKNVENCLGTIVVCTAFNMYVITMNPSLNLSEGLTNNKMARLVKTV